MGQEERQKGKRTKLGLFISRHYVRPEHEGKIVNTPDTALLAEENEQKGTRSTSQNRPQPTRPHNQ